MIQESASMEIFDPVIVYGTLKRNFLNHSVITQHDAKYLGIARTIDGIYDMAEVSSDYVETPFPAVHRGDFDIEGELYATSPELLAAMDYLEQVPTFYNRILCRVDSPEVDEAWIYVGTQELLNCCVNNPSTIICSGEIKRWIG